MYENPMGFHTRYILRAKCDIIKGILLDAFYCDMPEARYALRGVGVYIPVKSKEGIKLSFAVSPSWINAFFTPRCRA